MRISQIHARQIFDSRGYPTVEADVMLEDGTLGRASVPSGASTGINEALELRDNDLSKFAGKGVLKAVENINTEIALALKGVVADKQAELDQKLMDLDGTENKSRLGANSILAVSLACAYAAASSKKLPLYQYFNSLTKQLPEPSLPLPLMNIINGGKHANWAADIQEFMILPVGAKSFSQAMQMGAEVFYQLGAVLKEKGC